MAFDITALTDYVEEIQGENFYLLADEGNSFRSYPS